MMFQNLKQLNTRLKIIQVNKLKEEHSHLVITIIAIHYLFFFKYRRQLAKWYTMTCLCIILVTVGKNGLLHAFL